VVYSEKLYTTLWRIYDFSCLRADPRSWSFASNFDVSIQGREAVSEISQPRRFSGLLSDPAPISP